MLILALLLSFSQWLTSDPPPLPVGDVTQRIAHVVGDANRAAQVLAIDRAVSAEETAYQAALAPLREKLIALYTDRQSSEADFATITSQIDDLHTALTTRLEGERFAIRALLSAAEWQALYGAVGPTAPPSTTGK